MVSGVWPGKGAARGLLGIYYLVTLNVAVLGDGSLAPAEQPGLLASWGTERALEG